jgi:hypothetical protein
MVYNFIGAIQAPGVTYMSTLKVVFVIFGLGFVVAGIAGFVPSLVTDGNLFGILEVDWMHNLVHLVSGLLAFYVAFNLDYAKLYFKVFGVIYAVVTIVGFVNGGNVFLMHVNMADNFLHLVIAIVALYVGFIFKTTEIKV